MSTTTEEPPKKPEVPPPVKKKKDQDPLKKFKVTNKYDPYILKNSLDECIKEILVEKFKAKESHKYEDIKILIGIVICIVVALSHYYPLTFPDNYFLIIGCIIGYAILSGIYSYYESKIEKDCFILFKTNNLKMLRFASKIPLCDENYDISLEDPDNRSNAVNRKVSVGDYFDLKGNISYPILEKLVTQMLDEFSKKTNK